MEKDNQPLDFKPLTSGLGFHPFSDGLPYAPVSNTPNKVKARAENAAAYVNGAGAVSAGTPRFAKELPNLTPAKPVARVSVPVATPAAAPLASTAAAKPASKISAPEARLVQPTYGFGYLLKRSTAFGIDTALNTSLLIAALSFALMNQQIQPDMLMNPGVVLVSTLFIVLFNWAIITAQEVAFGTSIGKRIFRLTLEGPTSAIFLRAFFFLPSLGFLGAGLLWSVIDRRKRCWHDLIVDLQPIEIARL